jgi:hypothetical protein
MVSFLSIAGAVQLSIFKLYVLHRPEATGKNLSVF